MVERLIDQEFVFSVVIAAEEPVVEGNRSQVWERRQVAERSEVVNTDAEGKAVLRNVSERCHPLIHCLDRTPWQEGEQGRRLARH